MKRLLHTALLLWLAFSTGCKNRDELNVMDDEGLGLYWHHAEQYGTFSVYLR